jgi:peroxiredoxin
MKNILYIITLFAFIGLSVSLPQNAIAGKGKQRPQPFSIKGDIAQLPPQTVVLELLRANDSVKIVDSQRSNMAGHFEFSGTISEPGLYRVHFLGDKFILLSLDKGETKITSAWPIANYEIQGSASSIELKTFIDTVIVYMTNVNRSVAKVDSLKSTGNMNLVQDAEKAKLDLLAKFNSLIKKYCENTPYQPNAVIAVRILNPQEDYPYYESFDKSIDKRYPGTGLTKDYHQFFSKLKESIPESTEVGSAAPELKLEDTAGKIVTLSSLRGKYVLVDFWASWCGPCRAENPNVLMAYRRYKDKNFTILGVSLDNNKDPWIKAIHKDGLSWQHISDLKGWQSGAAAKYGVKSIPANFLVDPKGIIVGKNLRGPDLENKLQEVIK